jgi:hypothetical protein
MVVLSRIALTAEWVVEHVPRNPQAGKLEELQLLDCEPRGDSLRVLFERLGHLDSFTLHHGLTTTEELPSEECRDIRHQIKALKPIAASLTSLYLDYDEFWTDTLIGELGPMDLDLHEFEKLTYLRISLDFIYVIYKRYGGFERRLPPFLEHVYLEGFLLNDMSEYTTLKMIVNLLERKQDYAPHLKQLTFPRCEESEDIPEELMATAVEAGVVINYYRCECADW